VEGDRSLAHLISRGLENAGLGVTTTASSVDAILQLQRGRYSVILLDIILSGSSGIYVVDALRDLRPDERPKVVVITGARGNILSTLDRTIVSLPNGKLADARIETYGERDRVRLHTMISLVYSTTSAQIREVVTNSEAALRVHPDTYKDEIVVKFRALGPSSLDIEVMTWYAGTDFSKFRDWRQDMLLSFMAIVERAGTTFAYPTQTLHIASVAKAS
jgi:CheY-like chemotaxis protein